jgi:hypothetical protein
MATIRLHRNALFGEPEVYTTDKQGSLVKWLAKHAKEIGEQGAVILFNGVEIADSSKHSDMLERTSVQMGLFDQIDIYVRPADPATAIAVTVAVITAGVAIALAPKPKLPNDVGERTSSPNNQLSAANNEFRQRQAIPDIAGEIVAFPDFIQPSYYEYEGDIKTVTELFCVGVGHHNITNVKTSNTLIDDMAGSSYTVWQPSDTIPDQRNVRGTNEITGQEIAYYDDVGGGDAAFGSTNVSDSTMDNTNQTITLTDNEFLYGNNFAGIDIGDTINIDVDYIPSGGGSLTSFQTSGTVADLTFNARS